MDVDNQECPYCHKHHRIVIQTDPVVLLCTDDTIGDCCIDALYTVRIKEVVNLYAWCDEVLRTLTTTRIKAPTYILVGDTAGTKRLAQTNSSSRNLLVFPQSFENQCSYHSYSLSTELTEMFIVLLHEYEHTRQPRSLIYADSDAYRNFIEADADMYATRFLTKNLNKIENIVLDKHGVRLDDEYICKSHWIALGRLYSFYDAYKHEGFVHFDDADVHIDRMLSDDENRQLLAQLECYDSVFSDRMSLLERKY